MPQVYLLGKKVWVSQDDCLTSFRKNKDGKLKVASKIYCQQKEHTADISTFKVKEDRILVAYR